MGSEAPLKIVILGGGTAGWMLAASLTRVLQPQSATLRLIESGEIGIVGVGESTLPQVRDFNEFLGLNEVEFMRETNATFKLAIEFQDWARKGDRYFHPFGAHGHTIQGVPFFQCWLRAQHHGYDFDIGDYCYPVVASREQKFEFPSEDLSSIRSTYSYAYHFDAYLYSAFLRRWVEKKRGPIRTEGTVVDVKLRAEDGFIESLTLGSGEVVEGDLFIDCSGFKGVLINQALKMGWEDWSPWLPCDRAWAISSDLGGDFNPTTRCTAREAGWQWRIPLQGRFGTGYVFSSRFTTEDRARQVLLENLDGPAQSEPRLLRFQSGRRKNSWYKNCIAMGLASGFLEPLESTSIYLSQIAVSFLMGLLPGKTIDPKVVAEYNRLVDIEYQRVRDFLILHYHATEPKEGDLWKHVQTMQIPDSLQEKMEIFKRRGHIHRYKDGLFSPASWISVYAGQRISPGGYDPQADNIDLDAMLANMKELRERIATNVATMRGHAEFVKTYCQRPASGQSKKPSHV